MDRNLDKWFESHAKTHGDKVYSQRYRGVRFKVTPPVLDIGGSGGSFLKHFGITDATIMDAAECKKHLVGNYNFIEADITKKLPDTGKFRTVFIMEVLEHIKNPLYLMGQVYDLLEDDGICYIAVPYTRLDTERKGQKNPLNCHVSRWKLNELVGQMRKVGFSIRVLQSRRRFKNTAFFLPHCWIVLALKKRLSH